MSKQVYERLLAEFRAAWCRHGGELFNVRIFAPSRIMMGFGPSLDKPPYDLEKYDLIAEVALPLDASREVTPDGENSTLCGFAVSEREYRTAEALETFKRLCGEAGAALPPEFRDRVAGLCPWEMRKPATWWLALLVTLTGDSARLPDGRYLGEIGWVRPFLLCVEAIERCRLNTDKPEFPERNTGEDETPPAPPAPGNAKATETIDAYGYVTNPKDPTAYVAASDALRKHTPAALATTYKQFRAILDKHPEIRRWQVRKNRLSVHLADWTDYVQKETSLVDSDGLLADQFEIEARKADIRRKNKTRK